ncbi:hypothetical protein MSG28_008006 [Choristoneura fumiferana]|uniref:Uncharacterized protein n=1 Tax=Choristoneura fumiferana TaxID=7141 RepID=A0ACC0J9K5_CHOFU|nr:hypothetical protein MSG28_008006 [Choristoneura fumiferana]
MCCVCNLLCKIISFAISVLTLVALILLILWLVGVIFQNDDEVTTANNAYLKSAGEYKYAAVGASFT